MEYSFIAYIFLCIVIGLGIFSMLTNSGRAWSAVSFLVLSILIFVFYGLRWFGNTDSKTNYGGSWPPIINMCPDYLVYYKRSGTSDSCVDLIGVSRGSSLVPWTADDIKNPPQQANKYFNFVYKPTMTAEQVAGLCNQAMQAGLTWEGITNGESCTYTKSA